MTITGKLTHILPVQSGTGRNGEWTKQEFVITTLDAEWPKTICFAMRTPPSPLPPIGSMLTAHINIESREYNGKWYTNINAWKWEVGGAAAASDQAQTAQQAQEKYPAPGHGSKDENSLPF